MSEITYEMIVDKKIVKVIENFSTHAEEFLAHFYGVKDISKERKKLLTKKLEDVVRSIAQEMICETFQKIRSKDVRDSSA